MIKLALADIDNTLIPYGLGEASPKTIAAIREFEASGGVFGPISGRDWQEVTALFPGNESVLGCGVLVNGSRIYLDGAPVWEATLDHDQVVRIIDLVNEHEGFSLTVRTHENAYLYGWDRDFLIDFYQWYPTPISYVREPQEGTYTKATIHSFGDADLDAFVRQIRADCPDLDLIPPGPDIFDIVAKGCNKASGLDRLCELLGIGLDEVVVFGDSSNDLPVLGHVDNSVAVANASAEARELARWHIGPCTEGAVADALMDLVQARRTGMTPAFMDDEANRSWLEHAREHGSEYEDDFTRAVSGGHATM